MATAFPMGVPRPELLVLLLTPLRLFAKTQKRAHGPLWGVFFGMAVLATVTIAGWLEYYLLLFLLPTRITALFLAMR